MLEKKKIYKLNQLELFSNAENKVDVIKKPQEHQVESKE